MGLCVNVDDQMWRPAIKMLELCRLEGTFSAHSIFSKQQAQEGILYLISYKEEFLNVASAPQDGFIL